MSRTLKNTTKKFILRAVLKSLACKNRLNIKQYRIGNRVGCGPCPLADAVSRTAEGACRQKFEARGGFFNHFGGKGQGQGGGSQPKIADDLEGRFCFLLLHLDNFKGGFGPFFRIKPVFLLQGCCHHGVGGLYLG